MRTNAAITGLVAALLLAGCGSQSGSTPSPTTGSSKTTSETPSAREPSSGGLDVELAKGSGIVVTGSSWYVHGSDFAFDVTVTAPASEATKDQLTVVVDFPVSAMHVEKTDGEGWECADVDAGVSCTHSTPATAGEPWPVLTINAVATATTSGESITVDASGPGSGTATIPLRLDTST